MWSDILFWTMVGVGVIVVVRTLVNYTVPDATLEADVLEGLLASQHLQKGHYYLFVWDERGISQARARDVSGMLTAKGIDNGFLRTRGIPPVVYDLKRPEEPVEEVEHE